MQCSGDAHGRILMDDERRSPSLFAPAELRCMSSCRLEIPQPLIPRIALPHNPTPQTERGDRMEQSGRATPERSFHNGVALAHASSNCIPPDVSVSAFQPQIACSGFGRAFQVASGIRHTSRNSRTRACPTRPRGELAGRSCSTRWALGIYKSLCTPRYLYGFRSR